MKHKVLFLLTLAIVATVSLKAQLNVGSTAPADVSAILQATSTTKGFLPPVMTTTQINAILLPANGLTVYNTTLSQLQVNVGTPLAPSWAVGAGGANVYWSQQGNTGTVPVTNYVGTTDNASIAFRTNNAERVRIDSSTGFVGIGTTTPYAPLQLANTVVTRKLVLFDNVGNAGNDSAFYGFGVNSSTLRYQAPAGASHSFYSNKSQVANLTAGGAFTLNGASSGFAVNDQTRPSKTAGMYLRDGFMRHWIAGYGDALVIDSTGQVTINKRISMNNYFSVFIGDGAGLVSGGAGNTFIGVNAGLKNTSGYYNVFTGLSSGVNNTTGADNVFQGVNSGATNTDGSRNVFLGFNAGYSNTTAYYNVMSGYNSGYNTTGAENVFSGVNSGVNNTTGNQNTAVGPYSGPATGGLTNTTSIGANTQATVSNTVILGNGASVGIGTTTPAATLDVAGTMRVATTATAPNSDDLLTINGSGIFSRRTVASLATQTPDVSLYTTNGTLTSDRNINLNARILSITGGYGGYSGAINILSGYANAWSVMNFGRQGTEGSIGITSQSGVVLNASQTGDMMLWSGNNNIQVGTNGAGAVVLSTGANEHFRLASNGNVGINNGNPSQALQVNGVIRAGLDNNGSIQLVPGNGSQAGYLRFYRGDGVTSPGYIGYDNTDLYYRAENGAQHRFSGNNVIVENMINVGGAATVGSGGLPAQGGGTGFTWNTYEGGFGESEFVNFSGLGPGGFRFYRVYGGNTTNSGNWTAFINSGGAYSQVSDERTKTNIKTVANGLSTIMALHPISYNLHLDRTIKNGVVTFGKEDEVSKQFGFSAQEMYKVIPEAVDKPKDVANDFYSVNYTAVIPILTKAIQEQQAQIEKQAALNKHQQAQIAIQVALSKQQTAEITLLKKENLVIAAQLSDMKDLKIAMAQMRSDLNKTTVTQAVLPMPVTVKN